MSDHWRLLDTGLESPARNVALNRALLEARGAEEIASTLRFARITRCVMVGGRHSAEQTLDLDYCRDRGIPQQRRITGGAPLYVDERQLTWELYLHRRDVGEVSLHAIGRRINNAAAAALGALGVDARLRDRCQIEIDGRVVAEGGMTLEREAILVQSRVVLDAEPEVVLGVTRTPWSFDAAALATAARERVTSLALALGRKPDVHAVKANLTEAFESEFGVEFREADLGLSEHSRCEAALPAIASRDWLDSAAQSAADVPLLVAVQRTVAGPLSAAVLYERPTHTVRRVWFTAGCSFEPSRLNADLEAALCDVPLARVASRVDWFFGSRAVNSGGRTAADFVDVVKRAVRQPLLADNS